jgi:DNA mismatch repair ATPase MutS
MAELRRLQGLLTTAPARPADDAASPAPEALCYLVDEILQGTNSEERRIAGRRLIRHLLRRWAVGAVTTHDLELHRHPEVEAAARLVHFRETVATAPDPGDRGRATGAAAGSAAAGPALSFDYRLRPGLATTRNALRLAELTGLTEPDDLA